MSYETLAEATGCAVDTAKSRVFRARRQLEAWLLGDIDTETKDGLRPQAPRLLEIGSEKDDVPVPATVAG